MRCFKDDQENLKINSKTDWEPVKRGDERNQYPLHFSDHHSEVCAHIKIFSVCVCFGSVSDLRVNVFPTASLTGPRAAEADGIFE